MGNKPKREKKLQYCRQRTRSIITGQLQQQQQKNIQCGDENKQNPKELSKLYNYYTITIKLYNYYTINMQLQQKNKKITVENTNVHASS